MGCWDDECEYCMQEEREIDETKPDWEERRRVKPRIATRCASKRGGKCRPRRGREDRRMT